MESKHMNKDFKRVIMMADLVVIGCGIAGCTAALEAADLGKRVVLLSSATDPLDSNSYLAQGGIIYKAKNEPDEISLLSADIQRAGAGKCDINAVNKLSQEGPEVVEKFLLGGRAEHESVPFDKSAEGELSLCLEASHSRPRIIHWSDHTGRAIMENLLSAVSANQNIDLRCNTTAIDLLKTDSTQLDAPTSTSSGDEQGVKRCSGVFVLTDGVVHLIKADNVILATGGCGDIYSNTSNPASARGDGIAMALRAQAQVKNMEFIQFHPTTLYMPGERNFLLTEALRGEGALLRDPVTKELFAKEYHQDGELAPRDVVARMIISQMAKTTSKFVYLDITHLGEDFVSKRFPAIFKHCLARGLNLGTDLIPVVPAAHYSCGGVEVDLSGQTSLPGLYAVGEVSCTGLHGSNRLASTSLLEGAVWGSAAVKHMFGQATPPLSHVKTLSNEAPETNSNSFEEMNNLMKLLGEKADTQTDTSNAWLSKSWTRLRSLMWTNVGIVRHPSLLKQAVDELEVLVNQSEDAFQVSLATSVFSLTSCNHSVNHPSDVCPINSDGWFDLLQSIEGSDPRPYEQCHTQPATRMYGPGSNTSPRCVECKWQDVLGLRNACLTAHAVAQSALNNPESSGAHFIDPTAVLENEFETKVCV